MAYTVDTGSQKYYRQKNGLIEVKPIPAIFKSDGSGYPVDTGSQKYYYQKKGIVEVSPMRAIFAVASAALYLQTLNATAVGVATMTRIALRLKTLSASASNSATMTRISTFYRTLSASASNSATMTLLRNYYRTLSATASNSATLSRIATYFRTLSAIAVGIKDIVVVSSSANSGSSSAPSVSMPSGWQEGDLLVVVISKNGDATSADNNGSTPMTEDGDYQPFSGGNAVAVYSRKLGASEPSTWNFTMLSSQRWECIAFLVRYWQGTTIFDVAPSGAANSGASPATIPCASANIVTPGALAIAVANTDGTGNGTFPSGFSPAGWTDLLRSNAQQPVAVSYKLITAAGATGSAAITVTSGVAAGIGVNIFAIMPKNVPLSYAGVIARTLSASAVGLATLSRVVSYFRTLSASAVGSPAMTRFLSLMRTLSATSIGVATITRLNSFYRSLSATATGSATMTKLSLRLVTLSAIALGIVTLSLLRTAYVTLAATASNVVELTKRYSVTLSASAVSVATLLVEEIRQFGRAFVSVFSKYIANLGLRKHSTSVDVKKSDTDNIIRSKES